LSGNNETAWISKYSSFWKDISDDGVTANSAYGARLFKPHDAIAQRRFVQWDYIVNELRNDPDSRRAVMHLRTPNDSVDAKLDVPCTLALQFFIRDNKLHQVVHMRSSDVIFGIAYDVPAFTLFQEILANELDVDLGTYTHVSNSLHIYERHFEMAENILKTENIKKSIEAARAAGPQEPLTENSLAAIPIEELMWFEEGLPSYTTATVVVDKYHDLELCGYWSDMAAILAAKRIRELGDKNFAREFINAALHQSYSFYKRGGTK
jgi:thymidylate synthase